MKNFKHPINYFATILISVIALVTSCAPGDIPNSNEQVKIKKYLQSFTTWEYNQDKTQYIELQQSKPDDANNAGPYYSTLNFINIGTYGSFYVEVYDKDKSITFAEFVTNGPAKYTKMQIVNYDVNSNLLYLKCNNKEFTLVGRK